MPVYGELLDLQKEEAQIDKLKGETAYAAAHAALATEQAQAIKTKAQVDAATRQAEQALALAQEQAAPQPEGKDATTVANDPVAAAIRDAQRDIKTNVERANAIRKAGGDLKDAQEADQAAGRARESLRHNLYTQFETKKEQAKTLAQAAGAGLAAAQDFSGTQGDQIERMGNAIAAIESVVPGWSRMAPVDRDLFNNIVPGPKTAKAMRQTEMQGASVHDQLHDAQQKMDAGFKERQLAATIEDRKTRELQHDQDLTFRREKLKDTIAAREAAADAKKEKATTPPKITEGQVKDAAAFIQKENPGLAEGYAKTAARDYLAKVADLRQENKDDAGYTRLDAEEEALKWVKERIGTEGGEPGTKVPSYVPFFGGKEFGGKPGKPVYTKSATAKTAETTPAPTGVDAAVEKTAIELTKAKVPFDYNGDEKLYIFPNNRMRLKGMELLPPGSKVKWGDKIISKE